VARGVAAAVRELYGSIDDQALAVPEVIRVLGEEKGGDESR